MSTKAAKNKPSPSELRDSIKPSTRGAIPSPFAQKQKPTREPVSNEADNGLKNDRGTIAMARTPDPHSATAQFFINHANNDFLNHSGKNMRGWGYAVFGKVTEGMDVVDKIAAQPTGVSGGMRDVPETTVVIEEVTVSQ